MCNANAQNIRGKTPNSKIISLSGQVGQLSFTTCPFRRTCAHLTFDDLILRPDLAPAHQSGDDDGGVSTMSLHFSSLETPRQVYGVVA